MTIADDNNGTQRSDPGQMRLSVCLSPDPRVIIVWSMKQKRQELTQRETLPGDWPHIQKRLRRVELAKTLLLLLLGEDRPSSIIRNAIKKQSFGRLVQKACHTTNVLLIEASLPCSEICLFDFESTRLRLPYHQSSRVGV